MIGWNQEKCYEYIATTKAAEMLVGDEYLDILKAESSIEALKEMMAKYRDTRGGLYAIVVKELLTKTIVTRYLSKEAATLTYAPLGATKWKDGKLYVDGGEGSKRRERYEFSQLK